MKRFAMLAFLLPLAAVAQDRIEGLVEIPALHSRVNSGVRDSATGPVTLFAEPNDRSEVTVIVRDRRELESREHDYEQVSATVYGREANSGGGFWYKLRYIGDGASQFAWLNQTDAGTYRTLWMLIQSNLPYLTPDWNGELYESPSFDALAGTIADRDEYQSVRLIDGYRRGGQPLWFLLAVIEGECSGEPIKVIETGWVPAYSESGSNNVWFASRGC